MKKFLHGLVILIKMSGIYITIFCTSIVLLAFEKRPETPLSVTYCDQYKAELKATEVTYIKSYYGATHYEVAQNQSFDDASLLTMSLLFCQNYSIKNERFLFIDPTLSRYLVVNENFQLYIER